MQHDIRGVILGFLNLFPFEVMLGGGGWGWGGKMLSDVWLKPMREPNVWFEQRNCTESGC